MKLLKGSHAHLVENEAALLAQLRDLLPADVHEQLVTGGEDGLTETTLRKWLIARKWDVGKAAHDLQAHAKWRAAFVPHGRIPESDIPNELAQGKAFIQGRDRQGRALIIVQGKHHFHHDTQECERYIVYCIDAAIRMADPVQNPDGLFLCILDLTDIVLKNCDVHGMLAIFSLLQHQYVERLGSLMLYNAPTVFWGLWSVVKGFVDPVTRQKIMFVSKAGRSAVFAEVFEPQVLPECLDGTGRLIPAIEAVQQLQQQQGQQQQQPQPQQDQQQQQAQEPQQQEQQEQQRQCENTDATLLIPSSGAVLSVTGDNGTPGSLSQPPPAAAGAGGLLVAA